MCADDIDNNCNGRVDERSETGLNTFYADADGDGFGNAAMSTQVAECTPPAGFVASANDCNDQNASIKPGAAETCNAIDDNCSLPGSAAGGNDPSEDADGDSHSSVAAACTGGFPKDDCVDSNAAAHPEAVELCDGVDNDCSSGGSTVASEDRDGDSHADRAAACISGRAGAYPKDDCDDAEGAIHPGATEQCDLEGRDEDCDGATFGATDVDRDSHISNACCNGAVGSAARACGDDCDDARNDVYTGAAEVCDGRDNTCDGRVDEGVSTSFFEDVDGDSYGDTTKRVTACSAPVGHVLLSGDCNDAERRASPGQTEVCGDAIDNNCDGRIDERSDTGLSTFYEDADGDGFGNATRTTTSTECTPPPGYVGNPGDCNDQDRAVRPSAVELCDGIDNNCSLPGPGTGGVDTAEDRDGDQHAPLGHPCNGGFPADDCDDNDTGTYGGAPEVCDGRDNDCRNGGAAVSDEDADGDGHTAVGTSCLTGAGRFPKDDCDDTESTVHPGASEVCDAAGVDEDCSTSTLGGTDVDGDLRVSSACCNRSASGALTCGNDCDDARTDVYAGATEVCDGRDNNCDGASDEAVTVAFYADVDGDSYGDGARRVIACSAPPGHVNRSGDCNDSESRASPGNTEVCGDAIDNNCNLQVDERSETGLNTFYRDADGDGFGNAMVTVADVQCVPPLGYVANPSDCNDQSNSTRPGAPEICDGVDNNCSLPGPLTGGADLTEDGDGDRHARQGSACTGGFPIDDCDDTRAAVFAGATELCDGLDNDCGDGGASVADEDADGDGHTALGFACVTGAGLFPKDDCDDTQASSHPGATEVCDASGVDEDCNASTLGGVDVDRDLRVSSACCNGTACGDDCNDTRADVFFGATEVCDSRDNDCDNNSDEGVQLTFYADADGDSHGTSTRPSTGCTAPAGYVTSSDDCNDNERRSSPGQTEVCADAVDNNCNGQVDERSETGLNTFFEDADGDGFGNVTRTVSVAACTPPPGHVASSGDCNDQSASVRPGATEICDGIDNNCSLPGGSAGGADIAEDRDGDRHAALGSTCVGGFPVDDCDDTRALVFGGANELCDGLDNDCEDGGGAVADEDADGDGHTAVGHTCVGGAGLFAKDDCDDTRSNVYTGATEVCDAIGVDEDCDGVTLGDRDADGDGHVSIACCNRDAGTGALLCGEDCDDSRPTALPGGQELCDGVDNNCDGTADEAVKLTFYADVDGDTYGDASRPEIGCFAPAGYVSRGGDCNDNEIRSAPDRSEVCGDAVDNNCNGAVDERSETTTNTFYEDSDGDGFGNATRITQVSDCVPPGGYVSNPSDCNDQNPNIKPGAVELCDGMDNNCSLPAPATGGPDVNEDRDGDRHAPSNAACNGGFARDDCNDFDVAVYGGATEACDGADNDCSSGGGAAIEEDVDGDGHTAVGFLCVTGPGRFPKDDCDDTESAVHPGAVELCDAAGRDEDCSIGTLGARDVDGDGHTSDQCCNRASGGALLCGDDCDDAREDVFYNTNITEECDAVDNNCNGQVDEAVTDTFFADDDNDSYGDATRRVVGCTSPFGYVERAGDCDDTESLANPGNTEVCDDNIDNNCNAQVDEASQTGTNTFYRDQDGDGFGNAASIVQVVSCTPPMGYVSNTSDCNDQNAAVSPSAIEVCDRIDNNCSLPGGLAGLADASEDVDNDGFSPMTAACSGGFQKTDCVDNNAAIHPQGTDPCNGIDNDCSSGGGQDATEDADGDLHASASSECVGGAYPKNDCDDSDPATFGGALERCDREDTNCSTGGGTDASEDADDDGYAPLSQTCVGGRPKTDCRDDLAAVHPNAIEICDRIDSDCDGPSPGGVDPNEDADNDGHAVSGIAECVGGFPADDCADSNASSFPGAAEQCNRVDDDCSTGGGTDSAEDADRDGHAASAAACSGGLPKDDCDDTRASVRPLAFETCDGRVSNCLAANGGAARSIEDQDGDGHSAVGTAVCEAGGPFEKDDCLDTDASTYPNAPEQCDRIDNNCSLGGLPEVAEDVDNDGHASPTAACTGGPRPKDDCDDNYALAYGGYTGVDWCDGHNNDCDGVVDDRLETPAQTCSCNGSYCEDGLLGVGGTATLIIRPSGALYRLGEVFVRDEDPATTPVLVMANVAQAEAGHEFACARTRDHRVYCWGEGDDGQLGDGESDDSTTPVLVSSLPATVVQIAAGRAHACARLAAGTVKCWGDNSERQLGTTSTAGSADVPQDVDGLTDVVGIAAGDNHSCALLLNGSVVCWGENTDGQLGINASTANIDPPSITVRNSSNVALANAVEIAAAQDHACARRADGSVVCWGDNDFGQLGTGTSDELRRSFVVVGGLTDAVEIATGGDVDSTGINEEGFGHTCARRQDGTVWCWGLNSGGELGTGTYTNRSTPTLVASLSDAVEIDLGARHSCARRGDGSIACWGRNTQGQIGDGTSGTFWLTPRSVTPPSPTARVVAHHGSATCLISTTGGVSCTGHNLDAPGELGLGTSNPVYSFTPLAIGSVTDMDMSDAFMCASRDALPAMCWGRNSSGQLGSAGGNTTTPRAVQAMTTQHATRVATGVDHACAVVDGAVWCWGTNNSGQLGRGATSSSQSVPAAALVTGTATDVVAGDDFTCALISDGTVQCWGVNTTCALGNPALPTCDATTNQPTPTPVPTLTSVQALAAGETHVCALITGGTVRCWGAGSRLGDGSTSNRATHAAVIGNSTAVEISAGADHTCALLTNGRVMCWGEGSDGRLGQGTAADANTPVFASGVIATSIAAGGEHTCVVKPDGDIACWGGNTHGQFGTGSRFHDHVRPFTIPNVPP